MDNPSVSRVVTLVLEKNPELKTDQVKHILMHSARLLPGADVNKGAVGIVDALAAATTKGVNRENKGLRPPDSFCVNVYSLIKGQPLVWKKPDYKGINWSNLTWE